MLIQVLEDARFLQAIKALYGVTKDDHLGLQRVVSSAMMSGYIRRTDGDMWGSDKPVKILLAETPKKRSGSPVGTDEFYGTVTRKDGTIESYTFKPKAE